MSLFSFFQFKKQLQDVPVLRFHNTLSGNLEVFKPLNGTVKIYSCGPTAYDEQHIGNLFPSVAANILHRTLNAWGYKVKEVVNITDFGHISEDDAGEDKMTKGLRREGLTLTLPNMRILAEKYAALFFADLSALGIDTDKITFPRASDYIEEQVALVAALEQKGYAYKTSDGLYFEVAKFPAYGKLGHINLAGQLAGARVEENKEKRGPYDFALWKFDTKLGWKSPWGKGFPGWHTECTAMIFTLLGKQIDIHMGGVDLVPVHHNNEIAQAESLTGKTYVQYWMHNAHITIEGKKISKSLGNTVYLHNIVDKGYAAKALRYWFLTGHYRTPMNFTWEALEGANTALSRLNRSFLELPNTKSAPDKKFIDDFYAAIANDLDTPQALARVWELLKDESVDPAQKRASLLVADRILGLGLSDARPSAKLTVIEQSDLSPEVQQLLKEREEARTAKDFTKSDELRNQVEEAGYTIKDTPEGQKLTKK